MRAGKLRPTGERRKPRHTDQQALETLAAVGVVTLAQKSGPLEDFDAITLKRPFSLSRLILDDRR